MRLRLERLDVGAVVGDVDLHPRDPLLGVQRLLRLEDRVEEEALRWRERDARPLRHVGDAGGVGGVCGPWSPAAARSRG